MMVKGARALRAAGPCTIVIVGATGDLTKRALLPALYYVKANGLLPRDFPNYAVGRMGPAAADPRLERDGRSRRES